MWDVGDIFDFKKTKLTDVKKDRDAASGEETSMEEDESRYSARKLSEVELEVEGTVRRGVDRTLMLRGLTHINAVVGEVYKQRCKALCLKRARSTCVLARTLLMDRDAT